MPYPPDYTHHHPGLFYANADTLLFNDQGAAPTVAGEFQRNGTHLFYFAAASIPITRASGARVYNDANLSINDITLTALTFNTERTDTDAYHSTVSETNKLTVPWAGLYLIGGHVSFAADADGFRDVRIRANGTTELAIQRTLSVGASDAVQLSISGAFVLAATNYVELLVYHNAGAALNVLAASAYSPEFWITFLGPVV